MPFEEEQHPDEAVPVDIELIRRADSRALRTAMEELPTEFREIVVLRDLEEMSYEEIAEIMQVSLGTVKSRLTRGRQALRQRLKTYIREVGSELGLADHEEAEVKPGSRISAERREFEVAP